MEKNFEESIENLEEIIKELESGKLTLDESMDKFKQGVELAKACNKKLQDAEKSIKLLVENPDGSVEEQDFEVKGE